MRLKFLGRKMDRCRRRWERNREWK